MGLCVLGGCQDIAMGLLGCCYTVSNVFVLRGC